MSDQPRVAKVLVALLVSMTFGAIVLMSLGNNPPSAGAFSLSSYCRLDSVEKAMASRVFQSSERWNSIEIYYSGTKAGNIEQLASLNGVGSAEELNCHFVICNGLGGKDGQIQSTEKWQRQWSIIPEYGSSKTIRVCVIAEGKSSRASDCQIKRAGALVDKLSRKFSIVPQFIYFPNNWR